MTAAAGLAFAAGLLGATAAIDLGHEAAALAGRSAPGVARSAGRLADTVLRAGREGRDPGAAERRRLLVAGGIAAFLAGWLVAGPAIGIAAAVAGPVALARVLRAARERYRAAAGAGATGLATALADALGGGHSVRGAIAVAAPAIEGPAGAELRRVASELELGARTDDALEALRRRLRSHGIDTIVAALLLQRASGGDLARLLRDCARSLEEEARVEADARAATAQARFTGLIVVLLPLGGALLAELATPGFIGGLASSFITAWLAGLALALQAVAAVLIRRLGRVRA
ncbi:MAG: tight adherence protein [Thermoleophilaceae bacterium]|nr:tight adherence protein [Thermoleophilaceae bacterium]